MSLTSQALFVESETTALAIMAAISTTGITLIWLAKHIYKKLNPNWLKKVKERLAKLSMNLHSLQEMDQDVSEIWKFVT